ncbi:Anthranilate synthase component 1 [archaeon HR04]|nr:Anthranilate synthase component 1 [archaeon HR04]
MDTFGVTDTINVKRVSTALPPFDIFRFIHGSYDHVFLLESLTGPREMAEVSIIGFEPYAKVYSDMARLYIDHLNGSKESYKLEEVDTLAYLRSILPRVKDRRFRYAGGAVGYVCYDAIRYWERLESRMLHGYPYMEFCIYKDGIVFDHIDRSVYYFCIGDAREHTDLLRYLDVGGGGSSSTTTAAVDSNEYDDGQGFSSSKPIRNMSKERFISMVERAKEYIYSGDIYQVVLSKRFEFKVKGHPIPFYSMLRSINPSPYMYYLKVGERCIVGSSPEMLVRVTGNLVETFPIAGTRRIVEGDEQENTRLRDEMLRDEKELAEHTMLVDLARNDLGRVCRWGTVKVDELMAVKRFSHVQHMVSHVTGMLRDDCDAYEAFRAVFPAGTVSGAPKVRAMEIIDELEPVARGPYAGAVGYFSSNGNCDFAIAIRSMFISNGHAYLQSGAGIVADSRAENEWAETEHKADALLEALRRANAG